MAEDAQKTGVQPNAYGCITVPFLMLAILTMLWGGRSRWSAGELARNGEVVQGQVVELRYVPSNPGVVRQGTRGGSGGGQSPVVNFTTRAGEKRTAIGSVNRRPEPWAVGDSVDIAYDPANPARADLVSEISGWKLWFGIWLAIATVFVAVASLPIVLRLRQGNRAN